MWGNSMKVSSVKDMTYSCIFNLMSRFHFYLFDKTPTVIQIKVTHPTILYAVLFDMSR